METCFFSWWCFVHCATSPDLWPHLMAANGGSINPFINRSAGWRDESTWTLRICKFRLIYLFFLQFSLVIVMTPQYLRHISVRLSQVCANTYTVAVLSLPVELRKNRNTAIKTGMGNSHTYLNMYLRSHKNASQNSILQKRPGNTFIFSHLHVSGHDI